MKEQLDYFRLSIFDAKSAYNAWKMIVFSRWENYVGKELADRYVKVQSYHGSLFSPHAPVSTRLLVCVVGKQARKETHESRH